MYYYTMGQWLLFFFFYCFCGWVWESCYVSALKHTWVNRGFLKGPWLPIYGSGAVLILLVTLPVKDNLGMVCLLGIVFPTILEYVTGYVMERIFRVRYWDYSKQKFQLNGYICLSSSLAWGFFSVVLVRFIHPFVEGLLEKIPQKVVDPVSFVLTVLVSVDAVQSIQSALDFKSLLIELTDEHEELRKLARRAEIVAALAEDDLNKFRDRTEMETQIFQDRLLENIRNNYSQNDRKKINRKEKLEISLYKINEMKMDILDAITEALNAHGERMSEWSEEMAEMEKQHSRDRNEVLENVQDYRNRLKNNRFKLYKNAFRIIHANPTATGKDFKDVLETLRKIEKDKNE